MFEKYWGLEFEFGLQALFVVVVVAKGEEGGTTAEGMK